MSSLLDPGQTAIPTETPGWQASLELGLAERGGRTVLAHKRQFGPLTVQRPFYPEGGPCHIYLLHPPGGVVGGDRLDVAVDVGEGAHTLFTTPGATKFYRSAGPCAQLTQRLSVAAGGVLEWFPQENILFPGANLRLNTQVELTADARFLGWEVHSLGRPAVGERFESGCADLRLSLRRAGVPLLLERLWIGDGVGLDGPTGLRGHPVTGTLLATGAAAPDLAAVRTQAVPPTDLLWGATLVGDLLIARCLAIGTEPVNRLFTLLWGILRPRLLGRPACPPRIWCT
ncbi:urease accessory protein UreD [uncultured Thiodictyon sp.]|uniref:urease accessory protein UreD n=1 Tax=uncultured Thiodictyon sp. TaxID=1846217 RepID=UPI0025D64361|nr:urease accessory protein UreD [uncultured Thiodictyon sp.]